MRAIALVLAASVVASGCAGRRCRVVDGVRQGLAHPGATSRAADIEVTVPYAMANQVIAGLLAQEPLTVPLAPPQLEFVAPSDTFTATVTKLELQPSEQAGRARFAIGVDVHAREHEVGAIDAVLEVEPVVKPGELAIGIGPQALVTVKPTLRPGTRATLERFIDEVVPERWKTKLRLTGLAGAAARRLGGYLTGEVWQLVREKLGPKIGDVTTIRLQLPDVPVARTELASTAEVLIVAIVTDLPVRAGVRTQPPTAAPTHVGVRLSGSAVAELANWAIDRGLAPRWYDRNGKAREDGEFRPRFDYAVGDGHPLKVYSFQDRGGCSYFQLGVKPAVRLEGDRVIATALDRQLEGKAANVVVELGAWAKFAVAGWVDRSKAVAARTRLVVGGRAIDSRVVAVAIAGDELAFELALSAPATDRQLPR